MSNTTKLEDDVQDMPTIVSRIFACTLGVRKEDMSPNEHCLSMSCAEDDWGSSHSPGRCASLGGNCLFLHRSGHRI